MRRIALVFLLTATACSGGASSSTPTAPAAPQAETSSPKDSPMKYTVLADEDDRAKNSVEYHVLVSTPTGETPKHDDVDALLKFLYRHLVQRREPQPVSINAYVYSNEAQYKTPPRSPIAQVSLKPGDLGPTFDNKVPLEFWQQIDQALEHSDKGWKLEKKIERNDAAKTLTIVQPYTEPGKDAWAEQLSFNMAMNVFTDTAMSLFEKVPELRAMTFIGRWKDEDVVKISLDRAQYQSLRLSEIEEQVGQLHGRAYLELSAGRGSDASIAKANAQRLSALYKKMLAGLKGQAVVSSKLK
jgi:hypothetical protein